MSAPECFMLVVRVAALERDEATTAKAPAPENQRVLYVSPSSKAPYGRGSTSGGKGLVDCVDGQEAKKRKTHHTSKAKDKEREAFG
jgi:hypothetical protein